MYSKGYNKQTIRTDKGTKYYASKIAIFLRVNGIPLELSDRVAHVQLNVAERMNRILA